MSVRVASLAALAFAGCAATGMTLRSHHYRVDVPPGWQVVEAGGDSGIPTLLRVPATDGGGPPVEVRLYAWLAQGPIADPVAVAVERLVTAGVLGLPTATVDDEPCAERASAFVVFERPARAVHAANGAGQRIVVTAGYDNGSLVGVVGIAGPGPSACRDLGAGDAAIARLVGLMAGSGDATHPI